MERYDFTLAQAGKTIGNITWLWDADEQGRSSLAGDAAALAHLQATMDKAVAEQWAGYPHPCHIRGVSDPLNHFYEMVLVLVKGGYDIPDALYPHTPEAWAASGDHSHDDEHCLFVY